MTRQSDTFARLADPALESLLAGASVEDAALHVGCSPRTVERWLAKGRAEPSGAYGEFAAAVDEAREARKLDLGTGPLEPDELEKLVWKAARRGNVSAMRLAWQLLKARRPPASEFDEFDELAMRRRGAARWSSAQPAGRAGGANAGGVES